MTPDTNDAQKKAAHLLWVELTTRITTQRLPFRSGDEEAAVDSVVAIFRKARELMAQNPGATDFVEITAQMLNKVIRPCTARWHEWLTADARERDAEGKPKLKFRDEWVRRQFRRELRALQPELVGYALAFGAMKDDHPIEGWWTSLDKSEDDLTKLRTLCSEPVKAVLGAPLHAGIVADQMSFKGMTLEQQATLVGAMNKAEHDVIRCKRGDRTDAPVINATALAFSGGGIRSATFCLGISQVLARRGLFSQFDYLSTVSGGGYLGSFLSSTLGTGERLTPEGENESEARVNAVLGTPVEAEDETKAPKRPETEPMRHLRNYSRYLAEGTFKGQLVGVGMVLAGAIFNLLILVQLPLALALLVNGLDAIGLFHMREWSVVSADWLPVHTGWGKIVFAVFTLTALAGLAYPRIKSGAEHKRKRDEKSRALEIWERFFFAAAITCAALVVASLLPIGFRFYDFLINGKFWPSVVEAKEKIEGLLATIGLSLTVLLTAVGSKLGSGSTTGGWLRKLAIIAGPAFCLLVFFGVGHRLFIVTGHDQWCWVCVLGVTAAIYVWARWLVDVNTYSPHGYYRDRLSDCYIRAIKRVPVSATTPNGIEMEPVDRLLLSELNLHAAAPYHLINTTLNIPTSTEREVRGRNADFFLLSKHYCGSPLTGYFPTSQIQDGDAHINLGTALAISGAAAGSNMGWQTDNALRMVMTLANVRLGYWLKNPSRGVEVTEAMNGPSSRYLLREMFALKMDETQPYLNLSDGGHHENMAVYELLRRRCKFIVAVDGGCEPDMQCIDLIRLERYAAIDLGIKMHYDISDLLLQSNGYSRSYGVLVKIDYNPPKNDSERRERKPEDAKWGWMLYLKLAMVGYGPGYVMDYKRTHSAFPHESTGDQIFDEAQFEAYRALGEAATESFFAPEITECCGANSVEDWFKSLAGTLLPDNDEAIVNS